MLVTTQHITCLHALPYLLLSAPYQAKGWLQMWQMSEVIVESRTTAQ